jgi:hypothetical protein
MEIKACNRIVFARLVENELFARMLTEHKAEIVQINNRCSLITLASPAHSYEKMAPRGQELNTLDELVGLAYDREVAS